MNRLDTETRIRVISALVEGCSLRSTCRMTRVAMNTVLKLLADLGVACDEYRWATALAFPDGALDYAQLIKVYAGIGDGNPNSKYSPPVCCGARKEPMRGWPDPDHISTSFVERQNLTMRMSIRRFTRLTNGHSKKIRNHELATALHFMHYNFCRPHMTLAKGGVKRTPAMAAGVADHVWTLEEMIALLPEQPKGRVRKIGAPPASERRLVAGYSAE